MARCQTSHPLRPGDRNPREYKVFYSASDRPAIKSWLHSKGNAVRQNLWWTLVPLLNVFALRLVLDYGYEERYLVLGLVLRPT